MPSSPDTKNKIVCMNRRRCPANVVLLPPNTVGGNAANRSDSPSDDAQGSPVFVSPLSTVGKRSPSMRFSECARTSPQSCLCTQSLSFSHATALANTNRPRPSPLVVMRGGDDVWQDPGELSLSTSVSSISMHRRPSLDPSRRSSNASGGGGGGDGQTTVDAESTLDKSPTTTVPSQLAAAAAPPPATTTIARAPRTTSKRTHTPVVVALRTSQTNANAAAPAARAVSPELVSIGTRQDSCQSLNSLHDATFLSDLGVSREGVDWERVDADPRELFRQRNVVSEPSLAFQLTKVSEEPVLDCARNTAAPPLTSAPRQGTSTGASSASVVPPVMSVSPPFETPAPGLKQPLTSCSHESSAKTESATCDTEEPVDVRVEDVTAVEGEKEAGPAVVPEPIAAPTEITKKKDLGDSIPAGRTASRLKGNTRQPPAAKAAVPSNPANENETNIFVAVRLRPRSTASGATGASADRQSRGSGGEGVASAGSCVRADARRGLVDCSTAAPAGVLSNGTSAPSSLAATAVFSAASGGAAGSSSHIAEMAAGKRTRTLRFYFDHILDDHVAQREVMEQIGHRAVDRVLAGYHGTVICYGQSGSGKTYTIVGPNGGRLSKKSLRWRASTSAANGEAQDPQRKQYQAPCGSSQDLVESPPNAHTATEGGEETAPPAEQLRIASEVGLLPRMLQALFNGLEAQRLESDSSSDGGSGHDGGGEVVGRRNRSVASWRVTFSALELYNEELRDLLPLAMTAKHQGTASKAGRDQKGRRAERPTSEEDKEGKKSSEKVEVKSPITLAKKHTGRAARGNGTMTKTKGDKEETSPGSGAALHASFPSYPGLFSSTGKSSLEDTRCWNAEDLDVLNAVSSSDEEDEDYDDSSSADTENTSGGGGGGDVRADTSSSRRRSVVLPLQLNEDGQHDGEPDPSRPTTNDFTTAAEAGSAHGRLTIGQLTSVSPSPPRHVQSSGAAAKKQVAIVDPKETSSAGNASNTKASTMQTRISRRQPTAASKSPSPLQKSNAKSGASGSGSPMTRTAARTSATAASTHSSVGNSQLVIRQGQPAPSPTATLTSPTKHSVRATSAKSRSSARPRGTTVKDADEAVYIEGLREHPIRDLHEAMRAVRLALRRRQMASTELNSDSSRAHTFFFVRVEQQRWRRRGGGGEASQEDEVEKTKDGRGPGKLVFDVRRSTLTLVDLAGSERVSHTGAHGLRLKEAQNINLSLSALGNVMRLLSAVPLTTSASAATAANDAHIPYRDSKLTRILQSSLGGNAITFLLCNVSPDYRDASETMSTLRFAKLSKTVKNNAKLNETVRIEEGGDEEQKRQCLAAAAAATAATAAKHKKEQQAAQAAVFTAESQVRELAGDAAGLRDQVQQLATYTWWLEEQLGHFASRGGHRASLPTSVTNAESGVSATALPASGLADVRSGEANSSVGHLSDTERGGGGRVSEKLSDASCGGGTGATATSSWWRLSPCPPSHERETEGDDDSISPLTPLEHSAQYWHSPGVRTFLSASYSLNERRREMQRRLIAAAASAAAAAAPSLSVSSQVPIEGLPNTHSPLTGGVGAAAATTTTPRRWTLPFLSPNPVPAAASAGGGATSGASPILSASPHTSVREGFRFGVEQPTETAAESHRHTALSTSGVFVSESSMADMYSPSLSVLTDGLPTHPQRSLHSAPHFAPSSLMRTSSQQQQQQQQQQLTYPSIDSVVVALAEECRAREAMVARLAETERQNLLLRLRLSSLQLKQQQQQQQQQQKQNKNRKAEDEATNMVALLPPSNSDATPSLLSPLHLQWPPHYSRLASESSLEAFLARCGFVPLNTAASSAAAGAAAEATTNTFSFSPTCASNDQLQRQSTLRSHLSSPSDPHSLRSITVDPSSLRALRDGSAARNDDCSCTEDGDDDGEGEEVMSNFSSAAATETTSISSVLAVVNAVQCVKGEDPLSSTPIRASRSSAGGHQGRSSSQYRMRAADLTSPTSSSPQRSPSPGWGQQLLNGVRNTLETVRAMSSQERFYNPEDINAAES